MESAPKAGKGFRTLITYCSSKWDANIKNRRKMHTETKEAQDLLPSDEGGNPT